MQLNSQEINTPVGCATEYDSLQRVIVCPPTYMKIGKIINETQKHFKTENIDVDEAMVQHKHFVDTLKERGVKVLELAPISDLYEQVFTRDIGFCIGETMYTSNMQRQVRRAEVQELTSQFAQQDIPYQSIGESSIEGGDVVVDGQTVWVGVSERTTHHAIQDLRSQLPKHNVIALPIAKRILHLDCAFNCIAPNTVLIYPDAFQQEDLEKIKAHYPICIEVSTKEQFTLGTNVLAIGNNTIISLPENQQVNYTLTEHGFSVIEVPFNEIIKSGGSFRCCTLPLHRNPQIRNKIQ